VARIFISYRREDSDIWVSRLADELRKHFSSDQVFQDVASIDPGADFVEALDKALGSAAVMLAVIGPGWLSVTDRQGRRRLDLPGDFVRQEIAESLRRPGVRVFPLLVGGAEMPAEDELPEPLKPLHRRQAFELTVRHWHNDIDQLVETLNRVPGLSEDRQSASQRAEQDAKRREAEARAARETAERRAADEKARKEAEEQARRKAEEEERRRAEERQKAAEDDSKRKAAQESAERKTREEAAVPGSKFGWKAVAGVGAIVGAVTLLVVFGGRERSPRAPQPTPPPAVEPAQPAPKPEAKVEAHPPETETRRIVIDGPKPLYAPYKTGDVFQECAECPEMVVIVPDPKGFTIGSPASEQGRDTDEKQFGPVQFAKPYAIGKFEVTRAQFKASGVQPGGGCYTWNSKNSKWQLDPKRNWEQPGFDQGPDHPVVCVNWNEVQEYLKWINRQLGGSGKDRYRLPSEAEWEYAARGGTITARFWGNEAEQACDYANVADRTAKKTFPNWTIHDCRDGFVYTSPVGRFTANQYGLRDMIGNVWEWVQDCYAEQYSASIRDGSAFETQDCGLRVVRGGAWGGGPEFARVANRLRFGPTDRDNLNGFRVARTL
jgi:formylglycine-generating enzyme required for sulfatase activity